ncbi:MAG: hypothetical protein U0457_19800 [Candidatus Sericytochromatia bacterium]
MNLDKVNFVQYKKLNIRSGYPYENDNLSVSKKMSLSDVRTYLSSKYKLYSTKRVVAQEVNKAFIESLTFMNGGSKGQLNTFLKELFRKPDPTKESGWRNVLNNTTYYNPVFKKEKKYNLLIISSNSNIVLPDITNELSTITITEIENKLNIVANGIN